MDEFIRTLIGDRSTISLDRPREKQLWTEILGVSEEELLECVKAVGTSTTAVRAYLRAKGRGSPGADTPLPSPFSEDRKAIRAAYLLDRARVLRLERERVLDELVKGVPNLIRAIGSGQLQLEYSPSDASTVSVPDVDQPHYLEALLYWRIRLGTTLPRLLEATSRLGSNSTLSDMQLMLTLIENEERAAGIATDDMPPDAPPDGNCLTDGIYKIIFSADSRLVGEGVCIARDDRFVGANFGYSVVGSASMMDSKFIMIASFLRHPGYQSPLPFPQAFDLTLNGVLRNGGFDGAALVPHTDITINIAGRRVAP